MTEQQGNCSSLSEHTAFCVPHAASRGHFMQPSWLGWRCRGWRRRRSLCSAAAILSAAGNCLWREGLSWHGPLQQMSGPECHEAAAGCHWSRRSAIAVAGGAAVACAQTQAYAAPKQPGVTPRDLGLLLRAGAAEDVGLKACAVGANCFSTTYDLGIDKGVHAIEPWGFSGKSPAQAMREVLEVVSAYPPGQQGIDGGGFEIKAADLGYLYVQFESLKKGYIDDVEFALAPGTSSTGREGRLMVRSSSRQGAKDYGVNALRLNYVARQLQQRGGWVVPTIDSSSHPGYWKSNCRQERVKERFPEYCTGV